MKFHRITFTIDVKKAGEAILSELLDRHWIACAQISRIESHYHWKGEREQTPEWKFELKTTLSGSPCVTQFILEKHSYDVPEILCEEVESVNPDFSQWLCDECGGLPS